MLSCFWFDMRKRFTFAFGGLLLLSLSRGCDCDYIREEIKDRAKEETRDKEIEGKWIGFDYSGVKIENYIKRRDFGAEERFLDYDSGLEGGDRGLRGLDNIFFP